MKFRPAYEIHRKKYAMVDIEVENTGDCPINDIYVSVALPNGMIVFLF